MEKRCPGNCLACGKCTNQNILDSYASLKRGFAAREGYGIAVDIGTTTVVLVLVDLTIGKVILRHSFLNPQRLFGPDVISRIDAANNGKLNELCHAIRKGISSETSKLLGAAGIQSKYVVDISISCNTVMTYLLLGLPVQSLGVIPFKPAFNLEPPYRSSCLLDGCGIDCEIKIIPWMGAFVGGDITAGLVYLLPERKSRFMLIDLGTNGELALFNRGELIVTATAAGPAFEQPVMDSKTAFHGASDVIRSLAYMIRSGELSEVGKLTHENVFTQKQVSDIQLAKSAIRSGIDILLSDMNLKTDELEAVYLAGGIGQALNVDDAITIGLIPEELKTVAFPVGNTSLAGAVEFLIMPDSAQSDSKALLTAAKEVNLAAHPRFYDCFSEYILFD